MTTITKKTSILKGTYLVKGTVGNIGVPGASIMHFSLVVVPMANSVSGTVEITQAIALQNGNIVIKHVTGVIRSTGFGEVTKVVTFEGEYVQSFPPPAVGFYLAKFTAHMAIDDSWNGRAGFSYAGNDIENVPVTIV